MSICWHAAEDVKDDSAEDAYVQWEASLSLFLFFILSLRFLSSLLSPLCLSLALCIFFSLSFSLSSLSLSLSLFFVFLSLSLSRSLSVTDFDGSLSGQQLLHSSRVLLEQPGIAARFSKQWGTDTTQNSRHW